MDKQIKSLVVEGAKYTANNDLEKASRCYAELLDLESKETEAINPDHVLLLASCLYQIGIEKNDMFGGMPGDGAEGPDDEWESEEESDDEHKEQTTQSNTQLDSNLYQFDQEEEDEDEDELSGEENVDEDEESSGSEDEDEGVEASGDEGEGSASTDEGPSSYMGYLEGDYFQNSLELLQIARIFYLENSEGDKLDSVTTLKLSTIYDLLGDVDQEIEDFVLAVQDYKQAIEYLKKTTEFETETDRENKIISVYTKLVESLRWCTDFTEINKSERKSYLTSMKELLEKKINDKTSQNIDEDKQQLKQIQNDLEGLENNESTTNKRKLEDSIDTEALKKIILQKAMGFDFASSEESANNVNDLSSMVIKKRKKQKK